MHWLRFVALTQSELGHAEASPILLRMARRDARGRNPHPQRSKQVADSSVKPATEIASALFGNIGEGEQQTTRRSARDAEA